MPKAAEDYVHRIGRTGRAGNTGTAVSYFSMNDAKIARQLVGVLEEASQAVPPELKQMAAIGGGGGGGGWPGRGWGCLGPGPGQGTALGVELLQAGGSCCRASRAAAAAACCAGFRGNSGYRQTGGDLGGFGPSRH
jgi:ATP-dependent RNA helicase DDX5/DBP2